MFPVVDSRGLIVIAGVIILSVLFMKYGVKHMSEGKYRQDGYINENWLAEVIASKEGLKEQVDIGQIKEILHITIDELCTLMHEDFDKFQELIERHKN